MGEIADEIIDQMLDGRRPCGYVRQTKTCNRCGQSDLRWKKHEHKWRLFSDEGLHVCHPPKTTTVKLGE